MSNPALGPGQVALDLFLLIFAGILILIGLVLLEDTQFYPPEGPREERQRYLTGGPPFVFGIVFAILTVFRGNYRHWPSLFRRLVAVTTVAAAFFAFHGVAAAVFFGAAGLALVACAFTIGLLVVAALLLRRS